jgi:hypothetical protein
MRHPARRFKTCWNRLQGYGGQSSGLPCTNRRFNNLNRKRLSRYSRWMVVMQRHKSGAIHFHLLVEMTTQTYTDASQMPTREAINKLPWVSCTHLCTQISDSDGQKLSQTVIVKTGEESKKEGDFQRGNRSLTRVVTTWQKGRKAAALGLEPRTPRSRIWCATNCTTRHLRKMERLCFNLIFLHEEAVLREGYNKFLGVSCKVNLP